MCIKKATLEIIKEIVLQILFRYNITEQIKNLTEVKGVLQKRMVPLLPF